MSKRTGKPDGRPPVEMDLAELEKLCTLQCTQPEIASWFGVTTRTIESRVASDKKYDHAVGERREVMQLTFKEIMDRGYAVGRISLRRKQVQIAEGGNAAMAIFLGKNLLGQRDNLDTIVTGPAGGAVQINVSGPHERILGDLSRIAERGHTGTGNPKAQ